MVRVWFLAASGLVLAACGTTRPFSQGVAVQDWSGNYRFQWQAGTAAERRGLSAPKQVQIRPVTSAKEVPGADTNSHGPQWAISFVGQPGKPLPLKPFGASDYQDMGWVSLRAAGQITCLESGAFLFLCRVQPGSTVHFGRDGAEQLTSKTGLFGVVLHQGSFELTSLESL